MTARSPGLGRGLGALIPTAAAPESEDQGLVPTPGVELLDLPIEAITPNPMQPRTQFDEEPLQELGESLRTVGVLQPIVVRPGPDGRFELVAGERRWRAAQAVGLTSIPAIVRSTADDELLRDALLENLHRVQLNPLEEAAAYQQLLVEFECTQEELAQRVGKSRPAVANSLRLLRLPDRVQDRVAAGVLTAGHAKALLTLATEEQMEEFAQRTVREGLSVRALEEATALASPKDKKPATPRRAKARPDVFDAITTDLSDRLETRVRISGGPERGRLIVDFASVADLQRIVAAMGDAETWNRPAG